MTSVAFYIIAVLAVVSALAVVRMRDVFRAALFAILAFFAVAGIYVTLNADFLAVVRGGAQPTTSARRSLTSHVMAFAADRAQREGTVIEFPGH